MGIGKNLKQIAQHQPDKTAIIFNDRHITYDEFHQSICRIQKQLLQVTNNKKSKKVAILIGNEPEFLEVFYAVITLGWVSIPFDTKWSEREVNQILQKAKPDLIIQSKQFVNSAKYTVDRAYDIDEIKCSQESTASVSDWDINPSEHFYLGFTSGSTGSPKGFIRNHTSWLESFKAGEEAFDYGENDVIMAPGPLCHSLSLFGAAHALHIGATFHLNTTFCATKVALVLAAGNVTVMYAVPTMLYRLIQEIREPVRHKITFLSSGAKLDRQIKNELGRLFPNRFLYEYYGASELSFVSFSSMELSDSYPNSVGKAFPGVSVTIRDDQGNPVQSGKTGKIYIKSDFLFSGYVHEPEQTKKVLTEHGAYIGDLGFLNKEGALTIVGRENNMLISGGLNVYAEEVEKVIKEVEMVKEAIVVGREDEYWGQKVVALIQWENQADPDFLKAHCEKRLATYKIPKEFHEIKDLPYTSTGKIARKEIESKLRGLT